MGPHFRVIYQMEPLKLIVAVVVCLLLIAFLFWSYNRTGHLIPHFFTSWIIILVALYLIFYIGGYRNSVVEATIFTLSAVILFTFLVVLITDISYDPVAKANALHNPGGVLFMIALHLLPMVTLLYLNGWPTVTPNLWVVFGLMLLYLIYLLTATGHGVAKQYGLPAGLLGFMLIFVCVYGTTAIIRVNIPPISQ